MEMKQRTSISDELKKYDPAANGNDYIEIVEWDNGEGYDISIYEEPVMKTFSLTHGEIEALNFLIKSLEYNKSF